MSFNKKFLILGFLVLVIGATAYVKDTRTLESNVIRIGDTTIVVNVADTEVERAQGLSGRAALNDREGMLFIFENPTKPGFWMKDMNFAIDIIWIDSEARVIGIEKDISPDTYPKLFWPSEAIKYVLEVPAGFAQRHKVDIGTEVYFGF